MTIWSASSLLARIAALEAALQPFAELAPAFHGRPAELRLLSTAVADIKVGDLRAAQLALQAGAD